MKQFILFICLVFLVSGCSDSKKKEINSSVNSPDTIIKCAPYFIYDQVYHYENSISDRGFDSLFSSEASKLDENKQYVSILNSISFNEMKDTLLFEKIENYGYKKKLIDSKKYHELDRIFCKREHKDIMVSACAPIYRNIFVFKKSSKIVGYGLVCFKCSLSKIVGANVDTEDFGQSGDFEKLRTLIK